MTFIPPGPSKDIVLVGRGVDDQDLINIYPLARPVFMPAQEIFHHLGILIIVVPYEKQYSKLVPV